MLSFVVRSVAIDAAAFVGAHGHEILEDVEHASHLAEDEHAVTPLFELSQKLVEQHHFAAVRDKMLA